MTPTMKPMQEDIMNGIEAVLYIIAAMVAPAIPKVV